MTAPTDILKKYFGYPAFRPLQLEIIEAVLAGKDTMALLPTGGGKSVCYQIPALCKPGICLVITPLIALMKDQAMQLRRRNISALTIHSGMAFFEVKKTLQQATTDTYKFLFVSPERLQTRLFREFLPGMPINLVAIDEAHCISQWGYDFRPPYLKIADLREELTDVPFLALTASATPEVQKDICAKLAMGNPAIFTQSFARSNLSFSGFESPHKLNKLLEILNKVPGTGLVYCRNRRLTKDISTWLQQQGISASAYHAGLSSEERNLRQTAWIQSATRVMVCTNAFGMGIDKPDVRTVVHMGPPDNLEDYYQEAGRAGRDGKKAFAVLLYSPDDLKTLETSVEKKYPPVEVIQKVYQAIANYLQLPIYSGEGMYFDFDLSRFCENYKIDPVTTVNALQTLAGEGYISFNESVFLPARLGFSATKDYLYQFQQEQPGLEPLTKALLRTYEGIFDNEVNINEKSLARILRSTPETVGKQLQTLVFYQVVKYLPQKDTPQLFFPYNRIPADQVLIPAKAYAARKARHLSRVREMIRYSFGKGCRSLMMQHYFGEKEETPCGKCDYCLSQKKQEITKHAQLLSWIKAAQPLFNKGTLEGDDLKNSLQLTRYQMEQLTDLALREEVWSVEEDGRLRLNKE